MDSLQLCRLGSLVYPIMLAQQAGEMSEAKAGELLGLDIESGDTRPAQRITIAVALASGRYEGEASVIDAKRGLVEFPWRGNPKHRCFLALSELPLESQS